MSRDVRAMEWGRRDAIFWYDKTDMIYTSTHTAVFGYRISAHDQAS